MIARLSRSLSSIPSAAGGIARLACDRLREARADVAGVVAGAGFSLGDISDRKRRLDAAGEVRLLELAAIELHDDCLGLHLARDFELGEIGLLYFVISSSERLSDALRNAERYCAIINEGVRLKISLDGPVVIDIEYLDVDRQFDRQHIEFWMVTLIRICRTVTDARLAPSSVKLRHFRPQTPPELRSFLGCEIQFAAKVDQICFSAAARALPAVKADGYLNKLLLQYADDALGQQRRSRPISVRSRVEREIAQLLPHGKATLPEVCRRIGMSRRTLARALADEGTTFSEVLRSLREALAKRYLQERQVPVSEVAWLLGYREVSSFTTAFARWTGAGPRDFRKTGRAKERRYA
jgi:AraC-like DNA-binding protein